MTSQSLLGANADMVIARLSQPRPEPVQDGPVSGFDPAVAQRMRPAAPVEKPAAAEGEAEAAPAKPAAPVAPAVAVAPPAPIDPVQATLARLESFQTALMQAVNLMAAPRVIVRDEQGRIIRSEVQHSKDRK